MRPRRWHYKALIYLSILSLLFVGYLHYGLLPWRLNSIISERVYEITGIPIEFKKLLYWPGEGFSLSNIRVGPFGDNSVIAAQKVSIDPDLFEFIQNDKIVLRRILLENSRIRVNSQKREPSSVPNNALVNPKTVISQEIAIPTVAQSSVDDSISLDPQMWFPENVYISEIGIHNTYVETNALNQLGIEPKIYFHHFTMKLYQKPWLAINGQISVVVEGKIIPLNIAGKLNLDNGAYRIKTEVALDKPPALLQSLLKDKPYKLNFSEGRLDFLLTKDEQDAVARMQLSYSLKNLELATSNRSLSGQSQGQLWGLLDLENKKLFNYQGRCDFSQCTLNNIAPNIPKVTNVKASISFTEKSLNLTQFTGTAQNVIISAIGSMPDIAQADMDLELQTQDNISSILSALKISQSQWLRDYQIEGDASVITKIHTNIRTGVQPEFLHYLRIERGTLSSASSPIPLLKNIRCDIQSDAHHFYLKRGSFLFQDTPYTFDLDLPLSEHEVSTLNLQSHALETTIPFTWAKSTPWRIQNAYLKYYGCEVDFSGLVDPSSERAKFGVKGRLTTSFENIRSMPYKALTAVSKLPLSGQVQGPFEIQGQWGLWDKLSINADMRSDAIRYANYLLHNCEFQVRHDNFTTRLPYFRALMCDGVLGAKLSINTQDPKKTSLDGEFYLNDMDLAKLVVNQPSLAGKLNARVNARGPLLQPQLWLGHGNISIQNGFIFKTDKFRQMGQLPFVRVEGLNEVVFTDAQATFSIQDAKFITEDLLLKSESVYLDLNGSLDFKTQLDMSMEIHYSPQIMAGAQDVGGIAPFLIGQADAMISDYRLTGALNNPQFTKANNVPQKVANNIKKSVRTILR